MSEMPPFVRRAIEAQGKVAPEEVVERMERLDDDGELLGAVYPEDEEPEPKQEKLDVGSVRPADAP